MDDKEKELLDAIEPEVEIDELANLTPEEQVVAKKLIPIIAAKANARAEANKAKALETFQSELIASNKKWMEEQLEKWRKEMTPPSTEDINTLLNQEYAEFPLHIKESNGSGVKQRDFVIRELPLSVEIKVLKAIQKTLGARIKEFSAIEWNTASSTLDRIQRLVDMVPGALETLAECCALCLDPFQEAKIDQEWVLRHVGLTTLTAILTAQEKASRYRDFLSLSSRFIPGAMTQ